MREILFRGKRVDNGEWVEGVAMIWNGHAQIIKHHHMINSIWAIDSLRVISETVGQFTGLTDKNGTKIFEGDVYNMGDIKIKYVVMWHDTGFIGKQIGSSSYAGLEYWKSRIEVIGKIHDNPELLNQ